MAVVDSAVVRFSAQKRGIMLYYRTDNSTVLRSSHCWRRRVGVRSVAGKSEKLAQEGLRRNRDRLAVGECIRAGVRKVSHDLKGVRGSRRFLHRRKCGGDVRFGRLGLDEKPRRAVFCDKEIDLGLRLVPYVVKRIVAKTEIVPHVDGFEQMAGDKVFESGAFVRDLAPVPLIPFGSLPYGVFDVPEPRADGEAFVEILKCGDPCFHCCFGYAYLAGERCGHYLAPGTGEEEFRQDSYSCNISNLCKVAQIFPEELFASELSPAMGESNVALDKRLRESSVRPEGIPVFEADGTRRMDFGRFKFGADKFRDSKRVHVVEEVSSHQAVAAAFVDVEPCAAGDDKMHTVFVEIEETLKKRLPTDELVNLVKRDDGFAVRGDAESGGIRKPSGITCEKTSRCKVVPCIVPVRKGLGECGLAALARAGEKRHLAVVLKMFFKHGFVDSLSLVSVFHGLECIKYGLSGQYQTSVYARMVNTKLAYPLEWYDCFNNTAGDRALSFSAGPK